MLEEGDYKKIASIIRSEIRSELKETISPRFSALENRVKNIEEDNLQIKDWILGIKKWIDFEGTVLSRVWTKQVEALEIRVTELESYHK